MRQVKVFKSHDWNELVAEMNAFYYEAATQGFRILGTQFLSKEPPYIAQIVYDTENRRV